MIFETSYIQVCDKSRPPSNPIYKMPQKKADDLFQNDITDFIKAVIIFRCFIDDLPA